MKFHVGKRAFLAAAVLGAAAVFATGFLVALSVRSVVAEPGSAPPAEAPNPGHNWEEIGLPPDTWPGLDADTVDGMHTGQSGGNYIPYADASGNVGIGTESPQERLDVASFVHSSDGFSSGTVGNPVGLGKLQSEVSGQRHTILCHNCWWDRAASRYEYVWEHSSFGARMINFQYYGLSPSAPGQGFHFYQKDGPTKAGDPIDWGDPQFSVLTDKVLFDDAVNVGIGTTEPAEKLFVDGNIATNAPGRRVYLRSNDDSSDRNTNFNPKLFYEGMISGDGDGTGDTLGWGLHLNALPWTWGQDAIYYHGGTHRFHTANDGGSESEKVRITSEGKVGIGTAAPEAKLHVNGDLKVTDKLIDVLRYELKDAGAFDRDTGMSISDWICTTGSFSALDGDIQEHGTANIMFLWTYKKDGTWRVKGDFRSHNDHEVWYYDVVCFHRNTAGGTESYIACLNKEGFLTCSQRCKWPDILCGSVSNIHCPGYDCECHCSRSW